MTFPPSDVEANHDTGKCFTVVMWHSTLYETPVEDQNWDITIKRSIAMLHNMVLSQIKIFDATVSGIWLALNTFLTALQHPVAKIRLKRRLLPHNMLRRLSMEL